MKEVIIYCDGACLGNPGPGGYAALLMAKPNQEKVVAGYVALTTNNRMEIMAAIMGLKALKSRCQVTVFSDSQYVVKGMNEWIKGWQKSGFKNAKKQSVANADLWIELLEIANAHHVTWRWVRGHAGNEFNERVDEIAREQALLAMHLKATSGL
jgi:ribonuclease HI